MFLKKIFLVLGALLFFFLSFILEFSASYLLPYPFSTANMLIASLLVYLLWKERGSVVWLSFFIHFLAELLTPTPFGVVLFAGTLCIFLSFWLLRNVFISRSWYIAPILTVIALVVYRAIMVFFALDKAVFDIPLLSEILMTTILVTVLYTIILFISKRLNTKMVYDAQIN